MSAQKVKDRIIATEVSDPMRFRFLPSLFGDRLMMIGESFVYD